jgi:hypothetical protein
MSLWIIIKMLSYGFFWVFGSITMKFMLMDSYLC